MRFRFIAAEKAQYPVALLCRGLGVSRSGLTRGACVRPYAPAAWPSRGPADAHRWPGCARAADIRVCRAQLGIRASMSRRANCWDNAVVESFVSRFNAEALPDRPWADRAAATAAIGEYVDSYHHQRLHSALGYRSPRAFERETAMAY